MKEQGQWVELAGHDYVMDLIADLELPTDFPKQKSYFIISTDDPAKVRANANLLVQETHPNTVHAHTNILSDSTKSKLKLSFPSIPSALFGSGFDSDDEFPPAFPLSGRPAHSLPDSDGYFSHGKCTLIQCSLALKT